MSNLLTVATQVGILFALMALGAICRWTKLVDERSVKGMINVLILFVTPCLIVDVFQRPFDASMLRSFGLAAVIATGVHLVMIALAKLLCRGEAKTRTVLALACVFSNAGFMGVPLEAAILGPTGVFYGVVYVAVFNLFIWSWGFCTMKGDALRTMNAQQLRAVLINPGTLGVVIGLPLFLFSVTLPTILREPIHLMANLNTPLAMIVIGFFLAGADLRRVLVRPAAHLAAAVRLVACPLLLLAVLMPFRVTLESTMMCAMIIAASAPVAAMVTMFAAKYERDVDLSVGLVSGTTLASIVTMPFVIALALEWLK